MKKLFVTFLSVLAFASSYAAPDSKIVVTSYPWQTRSVTEMVADLKKMGVDKVSMFQNIKLGGNGEYKDVKFSYKMSPAAREAAKKIFDAAGIKVVGIGHMHLKDPKQIEEQMAFAKYFGVKVMTTEVPVEYLKLYETIAPKYGIKVGLYNHPIGRTLHPDNMGAGPASYGMTDTMGRMHGDAQFAGSSSVPAHVEMMGLIGMGNNPMVGATVAVAVAIEESSK